MTTTSKGYGDYVVFVESKALRGRSKQEYLRQVRKLGEHYAGGSLQGSPSGKSSTIWCTAVRPRSCVPRHSTRRWWRCGCFTAITCASSGRCGSALRSGAIVRCRWCSRAGRPGGYWAACVAGGFAQCWHSSTGCDPSSRARRPERATAFATLTEFEPVLAVVSDCARTDMMCEE